MMGVHYTYCGHHFMVDVSDQHTIYLTDIQCCMSITSQKNWEEAKEERSESEGVLRVHHGRTGRSGRLRTRKVPSSDTGSAGTLISAVQPPEPWEVCLSCVTAVPADRWGGHLEAAPGPAAQEGQEDCCSLSSEHEGLAAWPRHRESPALGGRALLCHMALHSDLQALGPCSSKQNVLVWWATQALVLWIHVC